MEGRGQSFPRSEGPRYGHGDKNGELAVESFVVCIKPFPATDNSLRP